MGNRYKVLMIGITAVSLSMGFVGCKTAGVPPSLPSKPCAPPAWFMQNSDDDGKWIGNGEGSSYDSAKSAAMDEISTRMGTWIKSQSTNNMERNKNGFDSSFQHRVELVSKHRLNNAQCVKRYDCGGRFFVQYAVDMRPAAYVAVDALASRFPGKFISFKGSPAFTQSSFSKEVERLTSGPGNTAAESQVIVPIDLTFQDGVFIVQTGPFAFPLSNLNEIMDLAVYKTGGLVFGVCGRDRSPRNGSLKSGDEFMFTIEGIAGYLTIFNLYPDGRVSLVAANRQIPSTRTVFPDPEKEGRVLEAGTAVPESPSIDTYVAVICPTVQDLTSFTTLITNGGMISGDGSFSARELVSWLDKVKPSGAVAIKVRTEP